MIVHMSEAALKQIKSGRSFHDVPIMPMKNLLCGEKVSAEFEFIGNSDIGKNGDIVAASRYKKVTCPDCIRVLKENGL